MCFEDQLEEVKGENNTLRKNFSDLTTNNGIRSDRSMVRSFQVRSFHS